MKLIILGAVIGSTITAAGGYAFVTMHRAPHSISWFKAHPAEMRSTLNWCQDHQGEALFNADCINAGQANW